MTRRDISLTVALCASLVVHALLLGSVAEVYNLEVGTRIGLPGFPREAIVTALLIPTDDRQEDPRQRLGDDSGKGQAISASPGQESMQARKGPQGQPFLSLDPEGPGNIGDDPTDSMLPLGRGGAQSGNGSVSPGQAAPEARIAEQTPQPPTPVLPPEITSSDVAPSEQQTEQVETPALPFGLAMTDSNLTGPYKLPAANSTRHATADDVPVPYPQNAPPPAVRVPSAAAMVNAPIEVPVASHIEAPAVASPGAKQPAADAIPGADKAADPAPQGDSESDPISTVGSAEFRRGSTDVQLGRKHKITRPHLTLAGEADLLTLRSPMVVLKINIDQTGKVTSVSIFRSSGSNEVDQPCKVAAYNWWFEPAKDKDGKAVKDVILFAIRFI